MLVVGRRSVVGLDAAMEPRFAVPALADGTRLVYPPTELRRAFVAPLRLSSLVEPDRGHPLLT